MAEFFAPTRFVPIRSTVRTQHGAPNTGMADAPSYGAQANAPQVEGKQEQDEIELGIEGNAVALPREDTHTGAHTGQIRRNLLVSLFGRDVTRLPEVLLLVTALLELLGEGLRGAHLQDAITEGIRSRLFICHCMVSTPAIYRSIRKTLDQSGVHTSQLDLVHPGMSR